MENILGLPLLLKIFVGKHAFGMALDEGEVAEVRGVYVQTPEDVLKRGHLSQIRVSQTEIYYELTTFIRNISLGDLVALELLFAKERNIIYVSPYFKKLLAESSSIVSKNYADVVLKKIKNLLFQAELKEISRDIVGHEQREFDLADFMFCFDWSIAKNQYIKITFRDWLADNRKDDEALSRAGLILLDEKIQAYSILLSISADFGGIYNEDRTGFRILEGSPTQYGTRTIVYFEKDKWFRYQNLLKKRKEILEEKNKELVYAVRYANMMDMLIQHHIVVMRDVNPVRLNKLNDRETDVQAAIRLCRESLDNYEQKIKDSDMKDIPAFATLCRTADAIREEVTKACVVEDEEEKEVPF